MPIPEQRTIIINKDLVRVIAFFLELHMYDFGRLYDQANGYKPNATLPGIPSLESRQAWLELIAELKGGNKQDV